MLVGDYHAPDSLSACRHRSSLTAAIGPLTYQPNVAFGVESGHRSRSATPLLFFETAKQGFDKRVRRFVRNGEVRAYIDLAQHISVLALWPLLTEQKISVPNYRQVICLDLERRAMPGVQSFSMNLCKF